MTEEERNEKRIEESNKIKIIVTAVLTVLLGFAFILALVNFGMGVQRDFDNKQSKEKESEKVVSILGVNFSSESLYYPVTLLADDANMQPKNALFSAMGINEDDAYYLIDSPDRLDKVLTAIKTLGGDTKSYAVEENFFQTGSVILVNSERADLATIEAVTAARDEDYNVQVDVKVSTSEAVKKDDRLNGGAVLIKVPNIQPKKVDVVIK